MAPLFLSPLVSFKHIFLFAPSFFQKIELGISCLALIRQGVIILKVSVTPWEYILMNLSTPVKLLGGKGSKMHFQEGFSWCLSVDEVL